MIKWYKSLNPWLQLFLTLTVSVSVGYFDWRLYKSGGEKDARVAAYIAEHNCKIVNYAGRDAEPVYQCDTGLLIKHLLREVANP